MMGGKGLRQGERIQCWTRCIMAGGLYGVREGEFSSICFRRVAIRRLALCRFGLPYLAKCGRE